MEIQFFHERFTEKDPKLLIDYVGRMASGEAPFFPTTLSLVYDKLVENAFPKHIPSGLGPGGFTLGSSTSTSNVASSSTLAVTSPPVVSFVSSPDLQPPAPSPGLPLNAATKWAGLTCVRIGCGRITSIYDLYEGLHCPYCPETGKNGSLETGRPFMRCTQCNTLRDVHVKVCSKPKCSSRFE
jgi:hypothetical protein